MDTEKMGDWFQLGVMFATIGVGLIYGIMKGMKFFRKSKTKKSEETFNYVNMKIFETLSELRVRTGASRVSLTQFHNGGKFIDGSCMRRMSISHQSCDSKTTSTMQFRQDVLVSRFVEIVEMLQDNDPRIRIVLQETDTNTKRFHELHDTIAFSIVPIYCKESLMAYGYISVDWCDFKNLEQVNEETSRNNILNAKNQISFLLGSTKDYR